MNSAVCRRENVVSIEFEGVKVKVAVMPGIPGGDHYPEFSEAASQVHVLFFLGGGFAE